jgi:HPt (histidine-containing phosphotransfer) domain-containing protein
MPDVALDPSVLDEYFRGNRQAQREFVAFFQANLVSGIESLRNALERGDVQQVKYWAHRLRGSASYVGAYRTARHYRQIEEAALLRSREELAKLVERVSVCQAELLRII